MKKIVDTTTEPSVRPHSARAGALAALTPELWPVQVLRDLLVEAWLGAIAGGDRPRRARGKRNLARSQPDATAASEAPTTTAREEPIRDRILAEIERQRGSETSAPSRAKPARRRARPGAPAPRRRK